MVKSSFEDNIENLEKKVYFWKKDCYTVEVLIF